MDKAAIIAIGFVLLVLAIFLAFAVYWRETQIACYEANAARPAADVILMCK